MSQSSHTANISVYITTDGDHTPTYREFMKALRQTVDNWEKKGPVKGQQDLDSDVDWGCVMTREGPGDVWCH